LVQQVIQRLLVATVITYNTAISICMKGAQSEVAPALPQVMQTKLIESNVVTQIIINY